MVFPIWRLTQIINRLLEALSDIAILKIIFLILFQYIFHSRFLLNIGKLISLEIL